MEEKRKDEEKRKKEEEERIRKEDDAKKNEEGRRRTEEEERIRKEKEQKKINIEDDKKENEKEKEHPKVLLSPLSQPPPSAFPPSSSLPLSSSCKTTSFPPSTSLPSSSSSALSSSHPFPNPSSSLPPLSSSSLFQLLAPAPSKLLKKSKTLSFTPLISLSALEPDLIKNIRKVDFFEFCENQLPKRTSWGKVKSVLKVMSFSDSPINESISQLNKDQEKIAKKIFAMILAYCEGKDEARERELARKIIDVVWEGSWELKDEAFLQVCKQIHGNNDEVIFMFFYLKKEHI